MFRLPNRLYRTPGLTQKRTPMSAELFRILAFVLGFCIVALAADVALCLACYFLFVRRLFRG